MCNCNCNCNKPREFTEYEDYITNKKINWPASLPNVFIWAIMMLVAGMMYVFAIIYVEKIQEPTLQFIYLMFVVYSVMRGFHIINSPRFIYECKIEWIRKPKISLDTSEGKPEFECLHPGKSKNKKKSTKKRTSMRGSKNAKMMD